LLLVLQLLARLPVTTLNANTGPGKMGNAQF